MSCHWLKQRDVRNAVVHGSTAIPAPPSAVEPNQSAALYGNWLIAALVGTSARILSEASTSQLLVAKLYRLNPTP